MPAIASGLPPVASGDFLICMSANEPSTIAAMAGSGPKQLSTRPSRPVTNDATANPWLGCLTGRGGGGGGCHTGVIGGRSSGATQPPAISGCRGNHCVSCSYAGLTCGSRITGFQFGSTGGDSSSMSIVPSSEQKVSQGSVYSLLHCGQYFICGDLTRVRPIRGD